MFPQVWTQQGTVIGEWSVSPDSSSLSPTVSSLTDCIHLLRSRKWMSHPVSIAQHCFSFRSKIPQPEMQNPAIILPPNQSLSMRGSRTTLQLARSHACDHLTCSCFCIYCANKKELTWGSRCALGHNNASMRSVAGFGAPPRKEPFLAGG